MVAVGDVITLPFFPHEENKNKGECRKVIVVEDLEDKILFVPLSCQTHQKDKYPKSFIILQNSVEGKKMKLTCDSLIIPSRATSLTKKFIKNDINKGKCSEELLDKILGLTN